MRKQYHTGAVYGQTAACYRYQEQEHNNSNAHRPAFILYHHVQDKTWNKGADEEKDTGGLRCQHAGGRPGPRALPGPIPPSSRTKAGRGPRISFTRAANPPRLSGQLPAPLARRRPLLCGPGSGDTRGSARPRAGRRAAPPPTHLRAPPAAHFGALPGSDGTTRPGTGPHPATGDTRPRPGHSPPSQENDGTTRAGLTVAGLLGDRGRSRPAAARPAPAGEERRGEGLEARGAPPRGGPELRPSGPGERTATRRRSDRTYPLRAPRAAPAPKMEVGPAGRGRDGPPAPPPASERRGQWRQRGAEHGARC
ncbi:translation initiation factor IF-2-like [Coturnix japonica]|uniref:translation initiation factor IF-2-like n=1 Tax=Coturnix japonica TaxID=93934 RepID=UPI0013A5C781|nr:translation initiation factor IF-2-like [Coturnix japonica]